MSGEYLLHTELALWSVLLGAFLCAVYDVFRLFRLRGKQNAVVLFVCDLAFCIISAVCMLILFFNLSYGKMRGYAFVFVILGFLIWRFTVSRLVMSLMLRLVKMVSRVLNSIKMRVICIIKRIMRRIYTSCYCKRNIKRIIDFKEVKRKENNNDGKETDSR